MLINWSLKTPYLFHRISNLILVWHNYFINIITIVIFRAPPYQGEAFNFCTFWFAGACGRRRRWRRCRRAWTPPLIHVTLISTKPLFQFIWCSTYLIQVSLPRLHQFFRKFGKIFRSLQPSLTFFRQIRTLSPWYLPNCFFDSFCVQQTGCRY